MIPCPKCGSPLTYIAPYNRYYCYVCRKYAPKDSVLRDTVVAYKPATIGRNLCPTCGGELIYVPKSDRYFCDKCHKFAPKGFLKRLTKR